jgi:hypothetical protein
MLEESHWKYCSQPGFPHLSEPCIPSAPCSILKTSSEYPFLLLKNNESYFSRYETDLNPLNIISKDVLIACTYNIKLKRSREHLKQCDWSHDQERRWFPDFQSSLREQPRKKSAMISLSASRCGKQRRVVLRNLPRIIRMIYWKCRAIVLVKSK